MENFVLLAVFMYVVYFLYSDRLRKFQETRSLIRVHIKDNVIVEEIDGNKYLTFSNNAAMHIDYTSGNTIHQLGNSFKPLHKMGMKSIIFNGFDAAGVNIMSVPLEETNSLFDGEYFLTPVTNATHQFRTGQRFASATMQFKAPPNSTMPSPPEAATQPPSPSIKTNKTTEAIRKGLPHPSMERSSARLATSLSSSTAIAPKSSISIDAPVVKVINAADATMRNSVVKNTNIGNGRKCTKVPLPVRSYACKPCNGKWFPNPDGCSLQDSGCAQFPSEFNGECDDVTTPFAMNCGKPYTAPMTPKRLIPENKKTRCLRLPVAKTPRSTCNEYEHTPHSPHSTCNEYEHTPHGFEMGRDELELYFKNPADFEVDRPLDYRFTNLT